MKPSRRQLTATVAPRLALSPVALRCILVDGAAHGNPLPFPGANLVPVAPFFRCATAAGANLRATKAATDFERWRKVIKAAGIKSAE